VKKHTNLLTDLAIKERGRRVAGPAHGMEEGFWMGETQVILGDEKIQGEGKRGETGVRLEEDRFRNKLKSILPWVTNLLRNPGSTLMRVMKEKGKWYLVLPSLLLLGLPKALAGSPIVLLFCLVASDSPMPGLVNNTYSSPCLICSLGQPSEEGTVNQVKEERKSRLSDQPRSHNGKWTCIPTEALSYGSWNTGGARSYPGAGAANLGSEPLLHLTFPVSLLAPKLDHPIMMPGLASRFPWSASSSFS
jgi:hypothetical protein